MENWAFVFNYERECSGSDNGGQRPSGRSKFKDYLNGARLVWADKATDTILLELQQDIPGHYGAYVVCPFYSPALSLPHILSKK